MESINLNDIQSPPFGKDSEYLSQSQQETETQPRIESDPSWEAGAAEQESANAEADDTEDPEESSMSSITLPSQQKMIAVGTQVIIVGNHKTEKDVYIGKHGVVKGCEALSYKRNYGYQILLDEGKNIRHFTVDAVEAFTDGDMPQAPTTSTKQQRGRDKATKCAKTTKSTSCTCNNTMSAAFHDECQFCREEKAENIENSQPVPPSPSLSVESEPTLMLQMNRKYQELAERNSKLEKDMGKLEKENKLLQKEVKQLKEREKRRIVTTADFISEHENLLKRMKHGNRQK